jgi:hypothetical protein
MHWHAALIISADLRSLPAESKAILLNTAAIAVDQDELGKMGRLVNTTGTRNQSAVPCAATGAGGDHGIDHNFIIITD